MSRCDALDFEIFGCVSGEFENFGSEVLEDGGQVDGGLAADTRLLSGDVPQMAFYAAAWELEEG
jgi:hypothetical protein